jgi:hypothetical protein
VAVVFAAAVERKNVLETLLVAVADAVAAAVDVAVAAAAGLLDALIDPRSFPVAPAGARNAP